MQVFQIRNPWPNYKMKNQDLDKETNSWNTCTTDCSKNKEMNGTHLGKRKKCRKKKHCEYLEEWLDKTSAYQHHNDGIPVSEVEEYVPDYWSPHPPFHLSNQQRLFTAASDPSMCHYSVPMGYSVEPVSLPVYPMYHHIVPPPRWRTPVPDSSARLTPNPGSRRTNKDRPPPSTRDTWHSCLRNSVTNSCQPKIIPKARTNVSTVNTEEFTSLPPVTKDDVLDNAQRRFSDPGFGPADHTSDEGNDTSDDSISVPSQGGLIASLVEQVNALQKSNRQLFRELRDTRVELQSLKTQASSWRHLPADYEPGAVSDLVREVRDASRVREEALLSRICGMMKGMDVNKMVNCLQVPFMDSATSGNQRLTQSESQLQKLTSHISNGSLSGAKVENFNNNTVVNQELETQLLNIEKEKLELRRELQEAVTGRKEAEAHAQKLERLVIILRKKINGLSFDEKTMGPASSEQSPLASLENTSESLASTVSSASCMPPHVTISGPVTQL